MSIFCDVCDEPLDEKIRDARAILIWGKRLSDGTAHHPSLVCKAQGRLNDDCDRAATGYLRSGLGALDLWVDVGITDDHWRCIITEYPWSKEDHGRLLDRREAVRVALSSKQEKEPMATRKKKPAANTWNDNDPVGVKRQRLVKWLMKKGVSLSEAKLTASRKYR